MRSLTILLLLVVGLTFSCAPTVYEGRKIDSAKVKQLVSGVTKEATVEGMFGKPDKVETLSSGEKNYIYEYCVKNPQWWTIDTLSAQKLEVLVKDGVVQTYKFTEEGKGAVLKE